MQMLRPDLDLLDPELDRNWLHLCQHSTYGGIAREPGAPPGASLSAPSHTFLLLLMQYLCRYLPHLPLPRRPLPWRPARTGTPPPILEHPPKRRGPYPDVPARAVVPFHIHITNQHRNPFTSSLDSLHSPEPSRPSTSGWQASLVRVTQVSGTRCGGAVSPTQLHGVQLGRA